MYVIFTYIYHIFAIKNNTPDHAISAHGYPQSKAEPQDHGYAIAPTKTRLWNILSTTTAFANAEGVVPYGPVFGMVFCRCFLFWFLKFKRGRFKRKT